MSRVQISYIGVCYAMLISLLALILLMTCILATRHLLMIAVLSLICLSLTSVAIGFMRRYRWAWYGSWAVGVLTLILGGVITWGAAHASPYGDGDEAGIIGVIMIAFALGGLWNMATSELERFVFKEDF